MPLVRFEGMESLEKMLSDIGSLEGNKIAEQMLEAGKKEVEKAWLKEIGKRDYILTARMLNKVKSGKPKLNKYGMFVTTYPWGTEERTRRGKKVEVTNASKAFMLHYGYMNVRTGKRVKGTRWVDDVEKRGAEDAARVMEEIYANYLKSKG